MTRALLEWETIDADQIGDIMEGKPPRAPKPVTPKPSTTTPSTAAASSAVSSHE